MQGKNDTHPESLAIPKAHHQSSGDFSGTGLSGDFRALAPSRSADRISCSADSGVFSPSMSSVDDNDSFAYKTVEKGEARRRPQISPLTSTSRCHSRPPTLRRRRLPTPAGRCHRRPLTLRRNAAITELKTPSREEKA
nr:hypothetical protein Iba_chr09bCG10520 [Ipomoea batatas]